ncbi:MAG: cation:proton antiporter subunit C [Candidatus Krumholzibacteriota bacterium]|nr:cation:proton antiporter subunit C [Candidatus Krumholzibacteriota bacterium]
MTGALVIGALLILVGLWGLMTRRNMIRMVLAIAVAETGLQIVMIAVGYVRGGTAPIIDSALSAEAAAGAAVDPVPQALVLTAIVIGVAVNALILALVVRLHRRGGSLDVDDYTESRW